MATVQTLGEMLPGLMLEVVVDPNHSDHLCLQTWNGHHIMTTSKVIHGGTSYIAMKLAGGLMRLVRFAPPSLTYGSTTKLVCFLTDFLCTYACLQCEAKTLLVAFALATWFCDILPIAPLLYLCGPPEEVSRVLRALARICRHAVLLGDVDIGGLRSLPSGLGATLLVNDPDLGRRVRRILLTSSRRDFCVLRGRGPLDVYGARAFACENFAFAERGLKLSLSPAQDSPPLLAGPDAERNAHKLRAKLLRYRMVHYREVRDRKFDCGALVPEMREQAQAWLAPLCRCPELSKSVFAEFLRQNRELVGARLVDPKSVVIEAALFLCHKRDTAEFFIGQLAKAANVLLKGRHEKPILSSKKVGLLSRELGLYGERVAKGYKIVLTDSVRERIHRLARDYQVPPLQDGVRRCPFCSGVPAKLIQ